MKAMAATIVVDPIMVVVPGVGEVGATEVGTIGDTFPCPACLVSWSYPSLFGSLEPRREPWTFVGLMSRVASFSLAFGMSCSMECCWKAPFAL
jgi:hypothetical protein